MKAPPKSGARSVSVLPRPWPRLIRVFTRYSRYYLKKNFHAVRLSRGGRPRRPRRRPAGRGPESSVVVGPAPGSGAQGPFPVRLRSSRPHRRRRPEEVPLFRAAGFLRRRAADASGGGRFPGGGHGAAVPAADGVVGHGPGAVHRCARAAGSPPPRRQRTLHGVWTAASSCRWPSNTRSGTSVSPRRWRGSAILSRSAMGPISPSGSGRGASKPAWRPRKTPWPSRRRRDPLAFETVVGGKSGVGGVYDRWRQLRAWLRGERFHPSHGDADAAARKGAP